MKELIWKLLLKLKTAHIKDKRLRNRYKRINTVRFYMEKIKDIRWGVSYSVFDGIELLRASLVNIRPHADYINVVYQDVSWFGEASAEPLLPILEKLQKEGLIDTILFYEPDFKLTAGTMSALSATKGSKMPKNTAWNII